MIQKPDIYFDLDGTLTDPYEGISKCILYALDKLGVAAIDEDELRACIGPPLLQSFERIVGPDSATLALTLYRERFGDIGWRENAVYEGIEETLRAVSADGHRLHVATSKPTVYATRIVEYFELGKYFISVHGSELDGTRTNKSELLEHCLHLNNSTKAIMIGDRKHDAMGAADNGMTFIAALYGYGPAAEFDALGIEHRAKTPADVPSLIRELKDFC